MEFPSIIPDRTDLPEYFQKEQPACEIDLISICLAQDVTDLIKSQQTPLTECLNWFDVARGKSRGKIIPVLNKSEELPFSPSALRFQVEKRVTERKRQTRGKDLSRRLMSLKWSSAKWKVG